MSAPLPIAAFPIGDKGGSTGLFVVAVLVGLAMYLSSQATAKQPVNKN